MSVHAKCLRYFHEIVEVTGKLPLEGKRLIEYGNLHSKQTARDLMTKWGYERQGPMKRYFHQLGIIDYSIDINGQDGSMIVDLARLLENQKLRFDTNLLFSFDILFDAGTSEHIDNQYVLWSNTFNLLKIGGLAIHILPMAGSYNKHGKWKFSLDWILNFTDKCKLQPVDFRIMGNHYKHYCENKLQVYFAYLKTEDSKMISQKDFLNPQYDERGDKGDHDHYGEKLKKVRDAVS